MIERHTLLNDEIFKKCKYVDKIQRHFGIKDLKKESKNKNSKFFGQYDILLDIFKTFILVSNCFFSDSNLGLADKTDKARDYVEQLIYNDYENSQKHKYSVRSIKGLCDKRATKLYNLMEKWQKVFMTITPKNANTSIELKEILDKIKKEMKELEYVEFDSIVNENITYQKNNIKNYRDYTKYFSRFDNIYIKSKEFKQEFKNRFYENNGIKLDDNDLNKLGLLFKLLASLNNGLVNIIIDYKLDEELTPGKSPDELYKIYLKSCNMDYENENFIDNSNDFICFTGIVKNKLDEELKFNNNILIERFDLLFFYLTMEQCFYSHKIKVKSDYINKLLNDLIEIYKQFKEIRKVEKELSLEELKEKYFIPLYKKTSDIIKRYGDVYERIS